MAGNSRSYDWAAAFRALAGIPEDAMVVMAHEGVVDHLAVERCVAQAEGVSVELADPKPVRKRLVNVCIEAMENLHRHVDEVHWPSIRATLLALPDRYRLIMCNAMPVTTAALLLHRLEVLNDMDEESLKQHYMALLGQEGRTERGGADLGLVTMARRSMRPMIASTQRLDEGHALFCLEVSVDRQG